MNQMSSADQVSNADRNYVKNVMNAVDDPLHKKWTDDLGRIHQVEVVSGYQDAYGNHENCPSPGAFRHDHI